MISSLKTSSLETVRRMKQSGVSCRKVSGLPGGLIFRDSAPLVEILGGDTGAGLVHHIMYLMFLCWIAVRIEDGGPAGVGFLRSRDGRVGAMRN